MQSLYAGFLYSLPTGGMLYLILSTKNGHIYSIEDIIVVKNICPKSP